MAYSGGGCLHIRPDGAGLRTGRIETISNRCGRRDARVRRDAGEHAAGWAGAIRCAVAGPSGNPLSVQPKSNEKEGFLSGARKRAPDSKAGVRASSRAQATGWKFSGGPATRRDRRTGNFANLHRCRSAFVRKPSCCSDARAVPRSSGACHAIASGARGRSCGPPKAPRVSAFGDRWADATPDRGRSACAPAESSLRAHRCAVLHEDLPSTRAARDRSQGAPAAPEPLSLPCATLRRVAICDDLPALAFDI